MKTNSVNYSSLTTFEALLDRYKKQYNNASPIVIEEILFIIRPLTRKELRDIDADISLEMAIDKQDQVCKLCTLYPPNFDLDECSAGVPDQLYKSIMDLSHLNEESMLNLLIYYREELEIIDNQMTCIIAKAFPSYKLEEIENMDMYQLCKLYTRAEWIIDNLNEDNAIEDIVSILEKHISKKNGKIDNNNNEMTELEMLEKRKNEREDDMEYNYDLPPVGEEYNDKPISKMTDEQRQAMDDFYRKFPMFQKETDYAYTGHIDKTNTKTPPGLRPNFGKRRSGMHK